ncbi:MAG: hypothetical protein M3327_14345 [Actinomycetota bacterium]|nr:hypothetical protein [Actinomycetota bacterium]
MRLIRIRSCVIQALTIRTPPARSCPCHVPSTPYVRDERARGGVSGGRAPLASRTCPGGVTEQDTFSANGKSLTGTPYRYTLPALFDTSGNATHIYSSGLVSKVVLPDGTLFVAAGRLDFTLHPDVTFLISPDVGTSGNVEAFCRTRAMR